MVSRTKPPNRPSRDQDYFRRLGIQSGKVRRAKGERRRALHEQLDRAIDIQEFVAQSRQEQGLPTQVNDPAALRRLATLLSAPLADDGKAAAS